MSAMSRRTALAALGAAAVAAPLVAPLGSPFAARAKAPLAGAPGPGVLRRRVGAVEVTALLDGFLDVDPALIIGYDAAVAEGLYRGVASARKAPRIPVNAYAVNFGDRLVLIDAGSATSLGPTAGALPAALAAAGFAPAQVDAVLFTHAHPDHVIGVLDAAGAPLFPNAELLMPETDLAFVRDEAVFAAMAPAMQGMIRGVRAALDAYPGRLSAFAPGSDPLPGLTSVPLPGHTPGHSGYVLASEGESLFFVADVFHVASLQFAYPEWAIAFDADPTQAIETRTRVLDRVAADRQLIAGAHLSFPGFGYAERASDAYRWAPAEYDYTF